MPNPAVFGPKSPMPVFASKAPAVPTTVWTPPVSWKGSFAADADKMALYAVIGKGPNLFDRQALLNRGAAIAWGRDVGIISQKRKNTFGSLVTGMVQGATQILKDGKFVFAGAAAGIGLTAAGVGSAASAAVPAGAATLPPAFTLAPYAAPAVPASAGLTVEAALPAYTTQLATAAKVATGSTLRDIASTTLGAVKAAGAVASTTLTIKALAGAKGIPFNPSSTIEAIPAGQQGDIPNPGDSGSPVVNVALPEQQNSALYLALIGAAALVALA